MLASHTFMQPCRPLSCKVKTRWTQSSIAFITCIPFFSISLWSHYITLNALKLIQVMHNLCTIHNPCLLYFFQYGHIALLYFPLFFSSKWLLNTPSLMHASTHIKTSVLSSFLFTVFTRCFTHAGSFVSKLLHPNTLLPQVMPE